jgi:hypothetical protein
MDYNSRLQFKIFITIDMKNYYQEKADDNCVNTH